ncbi:hypothetical protein GGI21_003973, partial [Coemansia aciculifera]
TNGAEFPKIEIRDSESGGGIYALEQIEAKENYAYLPNKLYITGKVCHDTIGTSEQQQLELMDDPWHGAMMVSLFLIHERFVMKEDSFWKPYIDILPREFHTPLQFNAEELKFLRGTPVELAVDERHERIRKYLHKALELVPESVIPRDVLTYENFLWAITMFASRSYSKDLMVFSPCDLINKCEVLLPLLDMTNHHPETRVDWMVDFGKITFPIDAVIEPGEQIFNNYGPKSNEELMMGYGFCMEPNPFSHFHIKLNYSQDPLFEAKERILEAAGMSDAYDHFIRTSGLSRDLLPVLRVMVMTDVDLHYIGQDADRELLEHPGFRNELRARLLLMSLLEKKLQAFEDAATDLPAEATTTNAQVALVYRTEIGEILHTAIADLKDAEQDIMARACQLFESDSHGLPRYICAEKPEVDTTSPSAKRVRTGASPSEQFISSVLVTSESFASDEAFLDATEQVDIDEDVLLALFLLRARMMPSSPWHVAIGRLDVFKHPMLLIEQESTGGEAYGEMLMEMGEIHDSLFPLLTEHFGDVFPADHFTIDKFLWASGIVEAFRIAVPPRCTGGECEVEGVCLI